jgi:hypothetical protein
MWPVTTKYNSFGMLETVRFFDELEQFRPSRPQKMTRVSVGNSTFHDVSLPFLTVPLSHLDTRHSTLPRHIQIKTILAVTSCTIQVGLGRASIPIEPLLGVLAVEESSSTRPVEKKMSLYDTVRANVDTGNEERVEVNQRALIDKILARYASAGAVYRELLQNSNDAEATTAEIYFTTTAEQQSGASSAAASVATAATRRKIVTSVQYRNNGAPFRPQDWARLKKIAEGNPDESKIGAFGVGAYTMFSICEEPLVLSGNQALAFVWKGDSLWTKTVDNDNGKNHKGWTSFILPSRDPYPLPDLQEFGEFLCAALTFTKCLREIRVFVDNKSRMTITKTQMQEPSVVQIQKNSSWWKTDGAATTSPNGLFSLRDENALLESFYHVQVTLDGDTAAVMARYLSAVARTKIPANMTKRMERVTKKVSIRTKLPQKRASVLLMRCLTLFSVPACFSFFFG